MAAAPAHGDLFATVDDEGREGLSVFDKESFDRVFREHLPQLLAHAAMKESERRRLQAKLLSVLQSPQLLLDFASVFSAAERRSFCDFRTHVCTQYYSERFPSTLPPASVGSCDICAGAAELVRVRPCCSVCVCSGCLAAMALLAVQEARPLLRCPQCQAPVPRDEVALHLPPEVRPRLAQLLADLDNDPSVKTCPNCGRPSRRGRRTEVSCDACGFAWCFRCHAPRHSGPCNFVADKRLQLWSNELMEDASQLTRRARRCPKCGVLIERSGGCAELTCTRCSTSFCFQCGKVTRQSGRILGLLPKQLFGNHESKLSIFGCSKNFLPEHPILRKSLRRSVFTLRLCAAPFWAVSHLLRSPHSLA